MTFVTTLKTSRGLGPLSKSLFAVTLVAICSLPVAGQGRLPPLFEPNSREDQHVSSLEAEMIAKREIEASNKAHKENVNRARNLVSLSESLVKAFQQKNQLDREDLKKLEKAEKLVKSIREAAGGSDLDIDAETRPADLGKALCKLSELSESLKSRVEKTPKRVVSTAIIDEANVLLELIRIVRSMQARA
jgi:molybdopterin converting factor small subunit